MKIGLKCSWITRSCRRFGSVDTILSFFHENLLEYCSKVNINLLNFGNFSWKFHNLNFANCRKLTTLKGNKNDIDQMQISGDVRDDNIGW